GSTALSAVICRLACRKPCMSTSATGLRRTALSAFPSIVRRSATHWITPSPPPALLNCRGTSSFGLRARLARGRIRSPASTSGRNSNIRTLRTRKTATASDAAPSRRAIQATSPGSRARLESRSRPAAVPATARQICTGDSADMTGSRIGGFFHLTRRGQSTSGDADRAMARGPGRILCHMAGNPYELHLGKNTANYAPLTPLSFLERAASVYPDRVSIIHGSQRYTWKETYQRARRFASALKKRGIGVGDTVSVMLPNIPAMVEAHFGVPMAGAVLNTLNTRLDAETIDFMLDHGEAKLLIADPEFSPAIDRLKSRIPLVMGDQAYEALLEEGDPDFAWRWPADEWEAIALNYTSGTTGNPKGVVYHHRGAYLNAVGNILVWGMPHHPVYLWTLPMFHCNGWCFPWTIAANAGTHVCLRRVEAEVVFSLIKQHKVTHYCGAPIVHQMLINAPEEMKRGIDHKVSALVAAAAPPASMIEGMQQMGFNITHVYGLTETYGPATVCAKNPEWEEMPLADQVRLNGRQGVRYTVGEGLTVMDPETMQPVPADGETTGEIMFRGNITMKGYLKNPHATEEAFAGGWFHSGDLAVL